MLPQRKIIALNEGFVTNFYFVFFRGKSSLDSFKTETFSVKGTKQRIHEKNGKEDD
jgi:hypothetical protein